VLDDRLSSLFRVNWSSGSVVGVRTSATYLRFLDRLVGARVYSAFDSKVNSWRSLLTLSGTNCVSLQHDSQQLTKHCLPHCRCMAFSRSVTPHRHFELPLRRPSETRHATPPL